MRKCKPVKRPAFNDIMIAADWLDCNEDPDGESEACARVATWLQSTAQVTEFRAAARATGCSTRHFRRALLQAGATEI